MTERKSFKRRVRARMEKTGERYTAARRQVATRAAQPADAEPTGTVSGEAIVRATGKSWDDWFAALDAWDATERSHREIARHLREAHGVPGWWAQSVTVGYERARGMRAKHQQPTGFAVTVSKTVACDADRLFAAFVDDDERARWLTDATLTLRTAQPGRSARFDWEDGRTRVNVYFVAKGAAKTTVAVEHERLADSAEAERTKLAWRQRLASLKELLEQ